MPTEILQTVIFIVLLWKVSDVAVYFDMNAKSLLYEISENLSILCS